GKRPSTLTSSTERSLVVSVPLARTPTATGGKSGASARACHGSSDLPDRLASSSAARVGIQPCSGRRSGSVPPGPSGRKRSPKELVVGTCQPYDADACSWVTRQPAAPAASARANL